MRQSNIELLRIICMFMIMCLHATLAIGYPECEFDSNVEYALIGMLKAFCVVAVNVFVMISGYFGIRFSIEGLLKFLFQVVFFSLVGYAVSVCTHVQPFSFKTLMSEGLILGPKTYWFVQSYLLLYVLSPVFNSACENLSRAQLKHVLIIFFIVQSLLGWQFATLHPEIKGGLSVLSFVGIYMLMRYVKLHSPRIAQFSKDSYFAIYLVCSVAIAIIAYFSKGGMLFFVNHFSYASPIVIVSSFSLLMLFTNLSISSKIINMVASSCFAVYLLHEQVSISKTLYRPFINDLYISDSTFVSGAFDVLAFMLIVYIISILLDKFRMCFYGGIKHLLTYTH